MSDFDQRMQALFGSDALTWADLDAMTRVEAAAWFVQAIHPFKARAKAAWLAGDPRGRGIFQAEADLRSALECEYIRDRKARDKAENIERDRALKEEQQRVKAERLAVQRETQLRKAAEWSDMRSRSRILRDIEAAHQNDAPLPEPIEETREEQIRNDALRSRGGFVRISTGNTLQRGKKPSEGVARP